MSIAGRGQSLVADADRDALSTRTEGGCNGPFLVLEPAALECGKRPECCLRGTADEHEVLIFEIETPALRVTEPAFEVVAHVVDDTSPGLDIFADSWRLQEGEGAGIGRRLEPETRTRGYWRDEPDKDGNISKESVYKGNW